MNATDAYTIRGLDHRYENNEGAWSLRIPELDLASGHIHALVGRNGAGKSTLLKLLALLHAPTKGKLLFLDRPTGSPRERLHLQRRVTLIHQKPLLFSSTVYRNLAYGLKLRGMGAREIRARVQAILERVGLAGFEKRRASALSGGEAHRVVLARALLLRTDVLLLDEPTSFLDGKFRPLLVELLREHQEKRGGTVIFASHDEDFVKESAQNVIHLREGKVRAHA